MDKINVEKVNIIRTTHTFECDMCGKPLGTTLEWEDGYYAELGRYEKGYCVDGKWYRLKKNLCDECAELLTSKIVAAFKELGFEKE